MIEHGHLSQESRVERRKRQTRQRIFQTALDLFLQKGLDRTTVAEIAEAADVGKGTFFTYFPTKESVFAEVSVELLDAMESALTTAQRSVAPIEDRILAFFRPAVEWHSDNPVLSRYMLQALMGDSAAMQADHVNQHRLYERLAHEIADAQAHGALSADIDVKAAVTAIAGVYFGCLGAWHAAGACLSLADDFTRSVRIVFRGLRP